MQITIGCRFIKCFWVVFCAFFLVLGCYTSPVTRKTEIEKDVIHAKHIVFIGLDGLGGSYMPKANMPTVKQMITEGSSSLGVKNILPTFSWPNWSALFRGTLPQNQTENNFPSIFSLIKNSNTIEHMDNGVSCIFYQWNDLDKICSVDEAEKIVFESNHESIIKIADYIRENKPLFTAIVFEEPDITGHKKAWGSKSYYDTLQTLDNFITIIMQAIKDAGIYDDTVFMLSSDHGGYAFNHWSNIPRNRKIPFIVCGKGIKNGYTILSSASICDIAPTMALSLGLEIPLEWTGKALTEIFE